MELLQSENFERQELTWADLKRPLVERRWLILTVFLTTALGAYAALALLTERYETTATLLVKIGRENAEVPTTIQSPGSGSLLITGVRKEELNSEIQMLTSRALIEATVDELGPAAFKFAPAPPQTFAQTIKYHTRRSLRWVKTQWREALILADLRKRLDERQQAVAEIEQALAVEPEKESDVIRLSVGLPDPQLCVRVADALIRRYLERRIALRGSDSGREFFDAQVTDLREQLTALERQRSQVRDTWRLSAVDEQRALLLRQLSEIQQQINSYESDRGMLERELTALRSRLQATPDTLRKSETVTHNPAIQSIKDRITTLKVERAKTVNRYTAKAEPVRKIDEEIATLEAELRREDAMLVGAVTSEVNPIKQGLLQKIEETEVRIAGLRSKVERLRPPADEISGQLRALNTGADRLERIERERGIAQQSYLAYAKRREEGRISEALDERRIPNISVITAPTTPLEPIYPRKPLTMAVALPAGLLLGVLLALLLEYLNDRVRTERDLEGLPGLPYLGTLRLDPTLSVD